MRIAVTGASGLIGSALAGSLTTTGHEVVPIVRRESGRPGEVTWDPQTGMIDTAALDGIDALVHLAGAPIGRRWTAGRKREILASRERGTRLLATALTTLERRPGVFVSASAVGIYGSRGDEVLVESSGHGSDFLATVCEAWEGATEPAAEAGIRVVNLRFGVVLEALLSRLLLPFRLGLGGRVGNGRHWLSWLALDDATSAIRAALSNSSLHGPINAASPLPVTNAEFTRTLGRVLHRPTIVPLPAAAVSLAFGEMGRSVLLASQRVSPERLEKTGFAFAYPELEAALLHALGKEHEPR
jgi:uncharacterized protein (TIGR01777 family)